MDHTEAVSSQAVERYLLGQMPDSEAESFEKHFFACAVCTEELAAGAILAENVRATEEHPPAQAQILLPKASKWNWFNSLWRQPAFAAPAFAALVLAGVVVYQTGQLARQNQPQVFLASALKPATRGDESRIVVPPGKTHFLVADVDLDLPEATAPDYRLDLCDTSGRIVFSLDSPAPPPGGSLSVLIPVRGLHSGAYTLRVHGVRNLVAGPEIVRYPFQLQLP